jgi:hypothetical protein
MRNSIRAGALAGAAFVVALAGAGPAHARSSQLLSKVGDGLPGRAAAADVVTGRRRVSLRVAMRKERLCYDLGSLQRERLGEARIRSRRPGHRGFAALTLFDGKHPGPRHWQRRCVQSERRVLRRLLAAPHAFSLVLSPRGTRVSLRGALGRAIGTMETHDLSQFDAWSALNGTLTPTTGLAYQGAWAAKAANGGGNIQYQRVWYDTSWRAGDSVWYGMALFIPPSLDWCWWAPIRWDDWTARRGSASHVGGVVIEGGKLKVKYGTYRSQSTVLAPVPAPRGRWFWLEVHQRLSRKPGRALTELFLDDRRVGRSRAPNTTTSRAARIRFGNVAMASNCSSSAEIYFDRVSYSGSRLGPVP